jgi:hypothetical protein
MTQKGKLLRACVYGALISVLSAGYFILYFYFLDLHFSLMQLFFVIVGTISYFILMGMNRKTLWQVVCSVIPVLFYFWSLINFAFFLVFKSFLDFSSGQVQELNWNL